MREKISNAVIKLSLLPKKKKKEKKMNKESYVTLA